MARYRRESRVQAPLERVWSFHAGIEGLLALTPGWFDLRVESARGPDGVPVDGGDELVVGTEVRLSLRPAGVGPRQSWTSRIVERERRGDRAWFRDVMVEGPVPRWEHTHRFRAAGEDTVLTDVVEYDLPILPTALAGLGRPFLEPLFAYRHRRTRARLEDGVDRA